jgi:hypothetical protein
VAPNKPESAEVFLGHHPRDSFARLQVVFGKLSPPLVRWRMPAGRAS